VNRGKGLKGSSRIRNVMMSGGEIRMGAERVMGKIRRVMMREGILMNERCGDEA
jgi:hypothetical protein